MHTQPITLSDFAMSKGLRASFCLFVSRLFLNGPLKRFGFRTDAITRFDSLDEYVSDRTQQIESYQHLFRPFCSFEGKTVLELGCNRGYLLDSFLKSESFTAIGADINEEALFEGWKAFGDRVEFILSTPTSIPLPDESVDIVYTIDTVEHLSSPHEIFQDVYRLMRPGATFLIHFCPWLGPYGSHLEDIIPIPWSNAFFSMDTLLTVASALYDSPEYKAACYYIDPQTGEKKPNPYLDRQYWDEYLNHITIRQFKMMLDRLPFECIHFEKIGFGGRTFHFARYLNKFAQLPGFDELFNKAVFCVLRKPAR